MLFHAFVVSYSREPLVTQSSRCSGGVRCIGLRGSGFPNVDRFLMSVYCVGRVKCAFETSWAYYLPQSVNCFCNEPTILVLETATRVVQKRLDFCDVALCSRGVSENTKISLN